MQLNVKCLIFQVYGKFSQKPTSTTIFYVHNKEELAKLFYSKDYTVEDVVCLSEKTCKVVVSKTNVKNTSRRETNLIITSFVQAISRVEMHKDMDLILKNNGVLLYHDTDREASIQRIMNFVQFIKLSYQFCHFLIINLSTVLRIFIPVISYLKYTALTILLPFFKQKSFFYKKKSQGKCMSKIDYVL